MVWRNAGELVSISVIVLHYIRRARLVLGCEFESRSHIAPYLINH